MTPKLLQLIKLKKNKEKEKRTNEFDNSFYKKQIEILKLKSYK